MNTVTLPSWFFLWILFEIIAQIAYTYICMNYWGEGSRGAPLMDTNKRVVLWLLGNILLMALTCVAAITVEGLIA